MTERYEVIWAKTAENDLLKIIEYIAQNSPVNSIRILRKIKKQTDELYHSPQRCRIVPELYDQGITQYREMVITPWRVMYRIFSDKVYVLSVLDSRRNIEDILLRRFTQNLL